MIELVENLIYSQHDCKLCGGKGVVLVNNYANGERDDVPSLEECEECAEYDFLATHAPEMNNLGDDEE